MLYDFGFEYSKRNPKKYLIEKKDIAQKRLTFLRHENLTSPSPLAVKSQDESYIFEQGTCKGYSWHDKTSKGCSQQPSSGVGWGLVCRGAQPPKASGGAGRR